MSKRQATTAAAPRAKKTKQTPVVTIRKAPPTFGLEYVDKVLAEGINNKGDLLSDSPNSNKDRRRAVVKLITAGLFQDLDKLHKVSDVKAAFGKLQYNAMYQAFGHVSTFFKNASAAELGLKPDEKDHLTNEYLRMSRELKKPYEERRERGEKSEKQKKMWIDDWVAFRDKAMEEYLKVQEQVDDDLSPTDDMVFGLSHAIMYIMYTHFYNVRGLWRTVKLFHHDNVKISKDNVLVYDDMDNMYVIWNKRKNDRHGSQPMIHDINSDLKPILLDYIMRFRSDSEYLFPAKTGQIMKQQTFCDSIQRLSQKYFGKNYGIQMLRTVQITYEFNRMPSSKTAADLEFIGRNYHHSSAEHMLYVKKLTQYRNVVDKEETMDVVVSDLVEDDKTDVDE